MENIKNPWKNFDGKFMSYKCMECEFVTTYGSNSFEELSKHGQENHPLSHVVFGKKISDANKTRDVTAGATGVAPKSDALFPPGEADSAQHRKGRTKIFSVIESLKRKRSLTNVNNVNESNRSRLCEEESPGSVHDGKKSDDGKLNCDTCGKSFPLSIALKKHKEKKKCLRKENMEESSNANIPETNLKHKNPYGCVECKADFSEAKLLKNHVDLHHKQDKDSVSENEQGINQKLKKREKTATKVKPKFECNKCDKFFPRKDYLDMHLKTHDPDSRIYKCNLCTFKSIKKFNYNQHKNVHTGEKPNVCKICKKAYSNHSSLYKHIKTKH